MPTRLLRDWTDSEKVNYLSPGAEIFFARLIMKADDYGCFWGDARLLKANLYPLRLEKTREADISRWIAECVKAGLILFYDVNQKQYVQIVDFRQRLDRAKPKFPLPPENHNQIITVNGSITTVNEFPPDSEAYSESEARGESGRENAPPPHPDFLKFQKWIAEHAANVGLMKEPFTEPQFWEIKGKFSIAFIQQLLKDMHNWKDLVKKNVSAYLTFMKWSKKEFKNEHGNNESYQQKKNEDILALIHGNG